MNKFKVRCTKAKGNRFIVGKVYEPDKNGRLTDELGRVGDASLAGTFEEWYKHCNWIDYDFEQVTNARHEIHITCTDGKTTHAVKKVDGKIVARSKAVCCPSDTFDFAIGANLAYDRLMRPETLEKVQPEQPKQEPVKLYCVKDWDTSFTAGRIYEVSNEEIHYDDGRFGYFPSDFQQAKKIFPNLASCLVPLVSRPAQVGEWVYVTSDKVDGVTKGEVCEVIRLNDNYKYLRIKAKTIYGWHEIQPCTLICDTNYLVLDGYTEPEKAEPEYLNMRVVCVAGSNGFTVGKVYEFKNGVVVDDDGDLRPRSGNQKITSLDDGYMTDWENKFIEFKGE